MDAYESLLHLVYDFGNPREMFAGMVKTLMADSALQRNAPGPLQTGPLDTIFYQISKKILNMMTRNYVSQLNDAVRQVKRANGGDNFAIQTRKIAKLTANVI